MEPFTFDGITIGTQTYLSLGLDKYGEEASGVPQVLICLSSVLERSVRKNEKLLKKSKRKDPITVFHGTRAPSLSIKQYLERIYKYSSCSPSCFVVAQIYIDRYLQRTNAYLHSLNVHRLLITSILVAAKFLDDEGCSNAYFAKVGGVSTSEMNKLEMNFLVALDFRLHVTVELFQSYCDQLQKEAIGDYQIDYSIKGCGIKQGWTNKGEAKCGSTIPGLSCKAM